MKTGAPASDSQEHTDYIEKRGEKSTVIRKKNHDFVRGLQINPGNDEEIKIAGCKLKNIKYLVENI